MAENKIMVNGEADQTKRLETKRKLRGINKKFGDGLDRLGTVTTELTPTRLARIFAECESPGRMGRLFELYEKLEGYDTKIKGLVEKRRKAPTRFDTKLKANYPDHPRTSEIMERLSQVVSDIDLKKLKKNCINGILHGVMLMENEWYKQGDYITFSMPETISSSRYGQFLEVHGQHHPDWGKLYIETGFKYTDKLFIDNVGDYKIFKAIYKDKKGYYDLAGVMRPVCKWYLFKYFTYQYWMEYNEVYGFPTTVATVPKDDYYTFKDELEEFMQNVGRNRFGLLLEGMEYQIHSQQSNGQVEFFRELAKHVRHEIVFGLLGTDLQEGGSQGSYAESVVGYDMETDLIIDDSEFVDDCLNQNLIQPFLRFNYADLPRDFIELHTNTPERKDWSKIERKWELAAKLGLKGVSKKQISEELEIDMAEDAEDSIDLVWQKKEPTGGEHGNPEKRNEEREDGGSVADDEDRE